MNNCSNIIAEIREILYCEFSSASGIKISWHKLQKYLWDHSTKSEEHKIKSKIHKYTFEKIQVLDLFPPSPSLQITKYHYRNNKNRKELQKHEKNNLGNDASIELK